MDKDDEKLFKDALIIIQDSYKLVDEINKRLVTAIIIVSCLFAIVFSATGMYVINNVYSYDYNATNENVNHNTNTNTNTNENEE